MGGKSRIIRIVVALIAVVLFVFAIMPQFFFPATASQVRPPVGYSLSPNSCCAAACGSDCGPGETQIIGPDKKIEGDRPSGYTPPTTDQAQGDIELGSDKKDVTDAGGSDSDGGGGSCPYLYTWDGTSYAFDNDIIPFKHASVENTNYYRIQQALIQEDGYYKFRVAEELPETSYLDSVRLLTVDHPSAVDVYPDLEGNIYNISNPEPLLSCVDGYGNDRLAELKGREEVYTPGTYFEGNRGDYVIADFGDLSGNDVIKLVLTSDGPPEENNPLPEQYRTYKNIYIESQVNRDGVTRWEMHWVFSPHELWATNVFDVTDILPDANGEYKLRFFFTNTHKIDFIGIDTTPEIDMEVHELAPVYANTGKDRLSLVSATDGNYVIMHKGDELFLKFPYQPASDRSDYMRNFVFVSRGYYIPDQK
jgi:hypothetical protein